MGPSKQLRDKVLEIIRKNKDINFDDIIVQMKKEVGIRGDSLIKLVDEILKWWEEGGKILQMVDKRSKMGMYRVNENTQVAKDIIDEALGELGISKTPEESLTESDYIVKSYKTKNESVTEAINPRTIDPKGWYGIYTHERLKQKRIVGPYPSEKEAYHDYGGDWDDIFIGAELIKKLNKGEYKAFTLKAMTESDESYYDKMKFLSRMAKSVWTADSVSKTADIGSDKGYGVLIKNTKTRYKHMIMMRASGKKIKVSFDFGRDEFVGTAQEVADQVNKILGIKEETEGGYITEARGYRKVKDLDGTKSLWELRTLYGMSYLIVSYSPQVDETAVFKSDRNGKPLSYIEVYSTRGRPEPEPIIRDIASGKIKPMDEEKKETK